MQIVIEISEKTYNNIMKDPFLNSEVYTAIKCSTVLPENHGRLVDVDAIKNKYPLMYNGIYDALNEAPTILEATI